VSRRQKVVIAVAFGAAALAIVTARVALDSAAAWRRGEAALARGDRDEAIRQYRDAARLYVPASPTVRGALDRLRDLAVAAETAGDLETARHALEAARAAILGTRSFYVPHSDRLAELEDRLAGLRARLESAEPSGAARLDSEAARRAWHLERLGRRPGPAVGFAILALAGFFTWIGAAVAFIYRGLDSNIRLRRRPAVVCGVIFAVGFAVFMIGLRFA